MAFTLRQETHAGFTTATGALTYLQGDNNFIGLYERDDLKLALTGGTLTGALTVSTGNFNVASGQILSGGTELSTLWGGGGGGATDLDGLTDAEIGDGAGSGYNIFLSNGATAGATPQHGTIGVGTLGNIAIGGDALKLVSSGDYNIALGNLAGSAITTGSNNILLGYNAGLNLSTVNGSVAIGNSAGKFMTGGGNIAILGMGGATTSGTLNVAIGSVALNTASSGAWANTCVGSYAGQSVSTGSKNTFVGYDSGGGNAGGSNNISIGLSNYVGANNWVTSIGNNVTATGNYQFLAGTVGRLLLHGDMTTAADQKLGINLGVTYVAPSATLHVRGGGATNATISFQVDSSLKNLMKLYDDGATIRIGSNAGYSGGAAAGGIYIGASAGWYPTGGSSVAIGTGAYQGTSAGNSAQCVAIGYGALRYVIDARFNTALGYNAGNALTDGDSNTLLGHTAGDNLTTGGNNIIIGKGVDASAIDVDDEINIGDHIIGSMVSSDLYTKFVGQTYGDLYTQADGVTIVPDFKNGNTQTVELGGNRAIDNPTNIKVGATYLIIIKQDATGSRTVTWGSKYKFPGGTAPTLTTTADQADVITMIAYNASILMCTSTLDFATS